MATTTQQSADRIELQTSLVVGLEIHVELATQSKMFTGAPNIAHPDHDGAEPNTLCDPVVLGMPGVLPVINREAVQMSVCVGLALDCQIAKVTKWDRKSYFYPDLPKNYQISQYDQPLCVEGAIDVPASNNEATSGGQMKKIRIIRAHLEEDAGKLLHEAPGGLEIDHSIVDLNRAGTPLLEIVTYPDFETVDEVISFCQVLRNICRFLGVTQGVMQKGHIRFEPNINVEIKKNGKTYKTPIVEIKNLNSFKAVHGSVTYEYSRQVDQWLETGVVMEPGTKSTRGWDDQKRVTVLQREKEEEHDYRYFPDPDLVPMTISNEWVESIRSQMPQLPLHRRKQYIEEYGLNAKEADSLLDEHDVCYFFEAVLEESVEPKRAAAMLLNYGAKRANEQGCLISALGITPVQVKQIIELADGEQISSTAADELFGICCDPSNSGDAETLAGNAGLLQVSDTSALDGFVDEVISNPNAAKAIDDIKAGKDKAIGALVGQVMKLSKGKANPKVVGDLIRRKLIDG